jgi:Mn-dependent DtxR family transcriptional regulator
MRHISGEGYKTISRVLKVSKSTVVSIIGKLQTYGNTNLSNRARRTLVREGIMNPMTTLTEL